MTDIARYKNSVEPNVVVANWMRNYNTIEYLGIWEQLNNPNFNLSNSRGLQEAGSNAFTLSSKKWSESTNAIGLFVKVGRGGGTFAHKDIAFKFASWISAEFELYIIKDYQRLKEDGRIEGRAEGKVEGEKNSLMNSTKNLMETFNLTMNQAMDSLKIPLPQRAEIETMLTLS